MTNSDLQKLLINLPHVKDVICTMQDEEIFVTIRFNWLYKFLYGAYIVEFIRTQILNKHLPAGYYVEILIE